jgi:hypothetical protein
VADLLFIVITIAFFAVGVAYVRLCDRIIGPDPSSDQAVTESDGDRAEREAVSA